MPTNTATGQQQADLILSGGTFVTMDGHWRVIDDGALAIADGRIIALGKQEEIERQYRARETLSTKGKLIVPGLINTHTHVPMTLFRGLADDLQLRDWLENHIFPTEAREVNEPFVRAGTRLALAEMIRGGTTTFCDMYYFEDAIAEETAQAGMRGLLAQTVIDFPSPDSPTPDEAFEALKRFVKKWKGHSHITPAIGPHAPYTVSEHNLRRCSALSESLGVPLVIHVSETQTEVAQILAKSGMRPVTYLDNIGFLSNKTVIAHAVKVDGNELDTIKRCGCGIAHNPESNMKLASGVAPLPAMLAKGIPVGLGTDGAASNNDLDMWGEVAMVAKLHKVIHEDPECVTAREAFAMATIGGARALHLDKAIGSLEKGKAADIVIMDMDGLHQIPVYDVYSCLVYSSKASDVRSVLVNGRWLMRDRKLLSLDEEAIRKETALIRDRIKAHR